MSKNAFIDLSEFLPPKKGMKVDLSEFLGPCPKEDPGPLLDPEILSAPLALELHMLTQHCSCGSTFTTPEGAFVEYNLKRLHGKHYKEVGKILLPLPSERPKALLSAPHHVRVRTVHITMCNECINRSDMYKDFQPESHEVWQTHRPPVLSQAWREFQQQVNPSREKLQEMIRHLEGIEAYKNGVDIDRKELLVLRVPQCDPEAQLEE